MIWKKSIVYFKISISLSFEFLFFCKTFTKCTQFITLWLLWELYCTVFHNASVFPLRTKNAKQFWNSDKTTVRRWSATCFYHRTVVLAIVLSCCHHCCVVELPSYWRTVTIVLSFSHYRVVMLCTSCSQRKRLDLRIHRTIENIVIVFVFSEWISIYFVCIT
jgi:hypothetical protein